MTERDAEIREDVERALWEDEVLRINEPGVDVDVQDGIATLRGYVVSRLHRERAEKTTGRVHGVQAVQNELITDDDLRQAVAQALARDPRTHDYRFRVDSFRGTVHLFGNLPSAQDRLAAEEVASEIPHVRGVVSRLNVTDVQTEPVL